MDDAMRIPDPMESIQERLKPRIHSGSKLGYYGDFLWMDPALRRLKCCTHSTLKVVICQVLTGQPVHSSRRSR